MRFDDGALALMSLALPAAAADFPEPRPALPAPQIYSVTDAVDCQALTRALHSVQQPAHLGGHDEFRNVREDEEDDGGVVEGFPAGSCSSTPPLHWRKRGDKQHADRAADRVENGNLRIANSIWGKMGEAFLDATAQKSAHHWKELVELRTLGRSFAPLGHLHHPPDPQSDP